MSDKLMLYLYVLFVYKDVLERCLYTFKPSRSWQSPLNPFDFKRTLYLIICILKVLKKWLSFTRAQVVKSSMDFYTRKNSNMQRIIFYRLLQDWCESFQLNKYFYWIFMDCITEIHQRALSLLWIWDFLQTQNPIALEFSRFLQYHNQNLNFHHFS